MLKLLVPATVALVQLSSVAMPAASAPAPGAAPACTQSTATGGDIRIVTCTLPANRAHRFTVNFRGGHDDTSASLTATLDGLPVNCSAESKTSLFGEDGDVSLYCRIAVADDAVAKHTLVVTVLWSHAQYRDFAFAAE